MRTDRMELRSAPNSSPLSEVTRGKTCKNWAAWLIITAAILGAYSIYYIGNSARGIGVQTLQFHVTNHQCQNNGTENVTHKYQAIRRILGDFSESEKLLSNPDRNGTEGISYLENYKNPCWFEYLPSEEYKYPANIILPVYKSDDEVRMLKLHLAKLERLFLERKILSDKQGSHVAPTRIRCLPYIFLIGQFDSGTTDLYKNIVKHPDVVRPHYKETHYWGEQSGIYRFSDYLNLFDFQAELIRRRVKRSRKGNHHPLVTIDATPHLCHSVYLNQHDTHCMTFPEIISFLTPKSKFILILREPVDWLHSCYNSLHFWRKSEFIPNFNTTNPILTEIKDLQRCWNDSTEELDCISKLRVGKRCHVGNILYYFIVKHWRDAVGERLLVLKSTDYFTDRLSTLGKIFNFLEMRSLPKDVVKDIFQDKTIANRGRHKSIVIERVAKEALERFIKPWNEKLASLLQDKTFITM